MDHLARCIAIGEVFFIVLSALSFFTSLAFGLFLLNALPGAAQRVPADPKALHSDVFSIANAPAHWTINAKSRGLRVCFLLGALFFATSVGFGLVRAALIGDSGLSGV
jgi:hypothetical protein